MKITKSELKEMIREALREELNCGLNEGIFGSKKSKPTQCACCGDREPDNGFIETVSCGPFCKDCYNDLEPGDNTAFDCHIYYSLANKGSVKIRGQMRRINDFKPAELSDVAHSWGVKRKNNSLILSKKECEATEELFNQKCKK